MGVGIVTIRRRVGLYKSDLTTPLDPATEQKQDDIISAIQALPAPPTTVTVDQGEAGAESWPVVEDNSALIATRLQTIITSLTGQREVATSVWTDDSGAYYVRRDLIDESTQPPTISITFTDETGTIVVPGAGLRPVGGSDREVTQVLYVATAGGTGYSVDDVLARITILDASVSPPDASAVWVNLTTGSVISTPTPGTYEDAGELVGIKGADGATIASDGNPLPTRLSDEQEAYLRGDATYYAGVASAVAVVIPAFAVGHQGHFTISGATAAGWSSATTGQAGLVAVEGSNDPGPGGGVPPTTGWGAIRMENANGQSTTAMRGGGSYSSIVTTRWMRVSCLAYVGGSMTVNLAVFPRNRQLFRQNIKDVDGLSSLELTPGTGMAHMVQRTPLVKGNFDEGPLDETKWTLTATGSGTATYVAGSGLKLATGTTPDSMVRIESMRKGNFLAAAPNIFNTIAATEAGAVAGCVKRWGIFDDQSGVFFEQFHDGSSSRVTVKVRKAGVDTAAGALNGVNNINDNAFGVPIWNLYELQTDPIFVKAKQSGILVHLFSGIFPTLFSRFTLPIRFEVINLGGTASNNTLYVQTASIDRLGPPETIRADQSFEDDDVLAAVAAVIQGRRLDGTFDQVPLPEHDRDLQNEQVSPLVNDAAVAVTVDNATDTFTAVGHGLVADQCVHFATDGTLPAPLTAAGHYFVVNPTADTFQVSTQRSVQVTTEKPPVLDITDDGIGNHTFKVADEFYGVGFTRIGDVDHTEILYASLNPMAVVEKIWSGDGINPLDRTIADVATTNGSPIVTSATANFTRYARGALLVATGIPTGAIIKSVDSRSQVTLDKEATATATGVTAHIRNPWGPSSLSVTTLQGYNVYYDVGEGRNMAPFYKIHVINGPSDQSLFPGFIHIAWLMKTAYTGSFGLLDASLNNLSRALLTRAVQAGVDPNGTFKNIKAAGPSAVNSTQVPLPGDDGTTVYLDAYLRTAVGGQPHIFRGLWQKVQGDYIKTSVDYASDVPGNAFMDISQATAPVDGIDDDISRSFPMPFDPAEDELVSEHRGVRAQWVRTRIVNGPAAQAWVNLDAAFLTANPGSDARDVHTGIAPDDLGEVNLSVDHTPRQEDPKVFDQVPATLNPSTGKRGKNTVLTRIEDEVVLRPMPLGPETEVVSVGASEAVRIDLPDITGGLGYRSVRVVNDGNFHAYVKEADDVIDGQGVPHYLGGDSKWGLNPGQGLWAICEDVGGTSQVVVGSPTVSGGTGTNHANVLADDASYSAQSAIGETIYAEGFSFAFTGGFTAIERLRLGFKGRKQPGQKEQVQQVETRTGQTTVAAGTVTTGIFSSATNALFVVAIVRNSATGQVNQVTHSDGTAFSPVNATLRNILQDGHLVDLWYAYGDFDAGTVTAALQVSSTALISATRIGFADAAMLIQAFGSNLGTSGTATGPTIAGTEKGLSMLFTMHSVASAMAGAGYTEHSDQAIGTGANAISLHVQSKPLAVTGNETATATLVGSDEFAALGITIAPAESIHPVATLSYTHSGNPGATSAAGTFDLETDETIWLDVTNDFEDGILPADIALLRLTSTLTSLGAAALQLNHIKVEVRETSGAVTHLVVTQSGVMRSSGGA